MDTMDDETQAARRRQRFTVEVDVDAFIRLAGRARMQRRTIRDEAAVILEGAVLGSAAGRSDGGGESQLVAHARRELELAGLFDADGDYNGDIGRSVLELVQTFARQGHSGGSAMLTLAAFAEVAHYRTLTPNDHSQHMEVADGLLQDRRDSRWLSMDAGRSWRNVETQAVEQGAGNG